MGPLPSKAGSDASTEKSQQLTWDAALDYRKTRLPSYTDATTGKRHLLFYRSKVGQFCKDTPCNRQASCGNGVVSDFVPYGSAITSTFKLQISLITVFAILSALMIPAITSKCEKYLICLIASALVVLTNFASLQSTPTA
jgi:hypothetical protein